MHDLTGFQRDLLYVAESLDEPNGLEIKTELDDYYRTDTNHSRLYTNLDALIQKGLVEKGRVDDRTNKYVVTERGRREIDARRQWEAERVGEVAADA